MHGAAGRRHQGVGALQQRDRGRIKVAVILLFIGFGVWVDRRRQLAARSSRRTPATFGQFGWSGVLRGAGVIFFAYIGFDAVSTAAQEAKNPQRDMPIGILGSLAVCTVLYIAVALVLTGMVPYTRAQRARPDRRGASTRRARRSRWLSPGQARRDRRPHLGDPRDAARPAAHLLRHGARRPAAAALRQGAPALPHAVRRTIVTGVGGAGRRRPVPDRDCSASWSRSARCSRSSSCARACSCCATRGPTCRARSACRRVPFVPIAGALSCGYRLMVAPAARHLGAPARLDGARLRHLRVLRFPAQHAAQGRPLSLRVAADSARRVPGQGACRAGRREPSMRARTRRPCRVTPARQAP